MYNGSYKYGWSRSKQNCASIRLMSGRPARWWNALEERIVGTRMTRNLGVVLVASSDTASLSSRAKGGKYVGSGASMCNSSTWWNGSSAMDCGSSAPVRRMVTFVKPGELRREICLREMSSVSQFKVRRLGKKL